MTDNVLNLIFAGVGGQGILTASQIAALVAMKEGLDVRKSEVKGLSQRGGSVVSFVRVGPVVYSPLVEPGTGHVLVGFEKAESLRWVHYLEPKKGILIVNDLELPPVPVTLGQAEYPQFPLDEIQASFARLYWVPAKDIAEEIGSTLVMNTVLLGVLSVILPFSIRSWEEVFKEVFVPPYRESNLRAFHTGRDRAEGFLGGF